MDHEADWPAAADDQVSVEKDPAATASFSLDDAFAEEDDIDRNYEFSSTAIRADLARTASYTQDDEESAGAQESLDVDAAGGTMDLLSALSLDPSSPTQNTDQLYAKFDSVSLSESPVEKPPHDDHLDDVHNEPEATDYGYGQRHTGNDSASEAQHHAVDSDASHIDLAASDAGQESPPPSPPPSAFPPDTPISRGESETPPEQITHEISASTPSATLPPVASSPAASSLPTGPSSGHRPTQSTGPSALEKVVSKTRPSFLPPKSRDEDRKHLADWERMMKRSRAAEERRRKALHERRLARELRVEQSLYTWEKEIIPDWKVVHRQPEMRKLWWAGVPTKLRATVWERAVGNALALSPDTYRICLARAKRALSTGTFPTTAIGLIEEDVRTTLPSLHIFHPDSGPMHAELKDMLYAWVVSRSDEGLGYIQGIARMAAMILLTMPAGPGFIVLKNLLERHCMRSFYGGLSTKDDVEAYYRIFDTLLADGMPKIYFNFKQHQISPSAYLKDWIVPLFLDHLPFEACARLWDVIVLEGDAFLYRASLAMLAVLESRLFFPDKQELLELLRGENKAALEVARRAGRPMNGGKYEIYGVDEETLWDRINFMNDWWKESTWNRLLQRELPDI
ncbi:rab-GTPase-TBC domain-containing protein [Russula brevipes]|nr:rab-GTPase-TBC domain-containing protein [Russula brevipes]